MPENENNDYEEIINDESQSQEENSEELNSQNENNEESGNEEEPTSGQPSKITKEFVEKHGLSPNLVGKPYDELATSYNEIRKYDTKLSQQIADLNAKVSGLEELSKKEVKQVEQIVEDKLPDYEAGIAKFIDNDGYVVDRAGFAKFNREYLELQGKIAKKEFQKALNDKAAEIEQKYKSTSDSVQESKAKEYQSELIDELSESLTGIYENVDNNLIDLVMKEYGKYYNTKEEKTRKLMEQVFQGNPKELADAIITYHKANMKSSKESDKTDVEKAALAAQKKKIQELKETNKKFTSSASSARDNRKESIDKDYDEVLEEAEQEANWIKERQE